MSQALEPLPRRTLLLEEAAAFLGMHPVTVLKKVRAGEIPAAKPGKRWVFLEEDLVAYLRGLYAASSRALQGDSLENVKCHSTNAKTHHSGGSRSSTVDKLYSTALGLPSASKLRPTTTS
jgi:excisionase family DNA binding protein